MFCHVFAHPMSGFRTLSILNSALMRMLTFFHWRIWSLLLISLYVVCFPKFNILIWGYNSHFRDYDVDVIFTRCNLFQRFKKLVHCFLKEWGKTRHMLDHWIVIFWAHMPRKWWREKKAQNSLHCTWDLKLTWLLIHFVNLVGVKPSKRSWKRIARFTSRH